MKLKDESGVVMLKVALDGQRGIWRRIAVKRDQTLDDLARAINRAFDRNNDHLYAFYVGQKTGKPTRSQVVSASRRYPHPEATDPFLEREGIERNAANATLASLRLADNQVFYYLFDFGDEWWHIITVEQTKAEGEPEQQYPAVIARRGESPEQYPEYEEE
ncbi:MAG: Plasmid pRiA4b ORF-3-like protein [bacterium ADurb.Bin429]|nr:MAG: Plasmid pRiA4b ORF-3-like protein [bacterium ADurb.Bin429]